MREVEELLESSRIGGRPTLSLELRQALAEMAAYYKAGHAADASRPKFARSLGPYVGLLEVSDDGETWRPLEQGSTARNPLQLAEQVGELRSRS